MEKKKISEKVSEALSGIKDLNLAVLFGSAAEERDSVHDVDLAILVEQGADRFRTLSNVVQSVSRALEVLEDRIDVVDLDRSGIGLKKEIVKSGIVLLDRGGRWKNLVGEVTAESPSYSELLNLSIREWLTSDDPSSINIGVVKRRLDFLRDEMNFLRSRILTRSSREVEGSPELKRLLERSFQLSVEAMLDVCRHTVSAKGWGPAYTHANQVERMKERDVLSENVYSKLIAFIGIRNIVVHRYLDVDYSELHSKAKELEGLSKEFEGCIVKLLREIEGSRA